MREDAALDRRKYYKALHLRCVRDGSISKR
jgi:hypothetical protein